MGKSFFNILFCLVISFCVYLKCDAQIITVKTNNTSLVFRVNGDKQLQQVYFGNSFSDTTNYSSLAFSGDHALPTGGMNYTREPAMEVQHVDGNISLQLNYVDSKVEKQNNIIFTDINLKDPVYPVYVTLHFKAFAKENVLEAWTTIRHEEKSFITLQRYASSFISLNYNNFYLTHFYGDYATEVEPEEFQLPEGLYNIQTKLGGARATYNAFPFFMISPNNPSTETDGDVFAGTLAWSGNFNLQFENVRMNTHDGNSLKIIPGINSYASAYQLKPKEIFNTPHFIFTYSTNGKGQASRNLHTWALNNSVWNGYQKRQTLLNNWEATFFDFTQDTLVKLFDGAKKLGVDLFLLDDGWFGNNHPRHSDTAGLGDWQANRKTLPDGIGYLVKQAEAKGVHFGIWIEPEMVNPKSDLYNEHPEWLLKLKNRPEDLFRNQLILDLCNPEVQDFEYKILHDLLSKNPGISYIKWDCNRYFTNTYSDYLGANQQAVYIDYVNAFYKLLERVRKEYPKLEMMLCSGGGGRAEYGSLKYFNEFWPSDNTDGVDRIFIQWGYSYFFPAATICNHVTSGGNQSLKFKIDVAMQGKIGFDIKVSSLSDKEIAFCQNAIGNYKRLQDLIGYGSLYRLIAPYKSSIASLMYVDSNKQKAVVFAYNMHLHNGDAYRNIKMQGLDATKNYMIKEINIEDGQKPAFEKSGATFSGEFLMKEGLRWYMYGSLKSSVLELTLAP